MTHNLWAGILDSAKSQFSSQSEIFSLTQLAGKFAIYRSIDGADLALVAADFGNCSGGCLADMDADNDVDGKELIILASEMGLQPQQCAD